MRTAGRCRHRPLRNSIENPCVGADAYIGPVAPIFKSYVGRRALTPPRWRSGYRTAGWGQPALQCLAPLPKGSLGGRIATGAGHPRNDRSRKNLHVIPRPVRRLVVGIRNTPLQRSAGTDCHTSDTGHWFAMTGSFTWCAVDARAGGVEPRPYGVFTDRIL